MKNKILLTFILGMFLISFTSAAVQKLGTFQQGNDINLIQTCATCTFNNITSVLDPNGNQIIGEFIMTRVGSVYNFTLTSENVTLLGQYLVNGLGDLEGTNEVWNYNFDLTADGRPVKTFPTQFVFILFGLILIMVGMFNERFSLFQTMGSMIWIVMGVLTLFPGYNFINHTNLFGLALGSTLIGMGAYFFIENSFSRTFQEGRFDQDQGFEEEDFRE